MDNTKARSDRIAAEATRLIDKIDFNHQRIHATLLITLYVELMKIADCSRSTAVRHIKAALGLTDPVGRLEIAFPVQRFNYRATDKEAELIKPELKVYTDKLLEELRGKRERIYGKADWKIGRNSEFKMPPTSRKPPKERND